MKWFQIFDVREEKDLRRILSHLFSYDLWSFLCFLQVSISFHNFCPRKHYFYNPEIIYNKHVTSHHTCPSILSSLDSLAPRFFCPSILLPLDSLAPRFSCLGPWIEEPILRRMEKNSDQVEGNVYEVLLIRRTSLLELLWQCSSKLIKHGTQ